MASSFNSPDKKNQPKIIPYKYSVSPKEKEPVLEALNYLKFLNRRQLAELTKIEISVLCRILNHLVYDLRIVKIAFYGRCSTTKKRVMYFTLNGEGNHD